VLVSGNGKWDLGKLGARPFHLNSDRRRTAITFAVPANGGNRQGTGHNAYRVPAPKGWSYLATLDVVLKIAPNSGAGVIAVSSGVNRSAGAKIEVKVPKVKPGRLSRASWNTLDLLSGYRQGPLTRGGRWTRIQTTNYLPFNSVLPGVNTLGFAFEAIGKARVADVKVLGDSGLTVTRRKPARLVLEASLPKDELVKGHSSKIGFVISNHGDQPARAVRVEVRSLSRKAKILGRHNYSLRELAGQKSGEFFIRPVSVGDLRVELSARSANSNQPVDILRGNAAAHPASHLGVPAWVLAVAVSACGLMAWLVWRRRRVTPGDFA